MPDTNVCRWLAALTTGTLLLSGCHAPGQPDQTRSSDDLNDFDPTAVSVTFTPGSRHVSKPVVTPGPTPTATPPPELDAALVVPANPAYASRQVHAFDPADSQQDFDITVRQHQALVDWHDSSGTRPAGGTLFRNLDRAEPFQAEAFSSATRLNFYLSDSGAGFVSWGTAQGDFITPMQDFQPAGTARAFEPIFAAGLDTAGDGDLYVLRQAAHNSELWRYPVRNRQPAMQAQRLTALPDYPRQLAIDDQGNGFVLWYREKYSAAESPIDTGVLPLQAYQPTTGVNLPEQNRPNPIDPIAGQGVVMVPRQPAAFPNEWMVYPIRRHAVAIEAVARLQLPAQADVLTVRLGATGTGLYAIRAANDLLVRQLREFRPYGPYYRIDQGEAQTRYTVKIALDEENSGLIVWRRQQSGPTGLSPGTLMMRPVWNARSW